MSRLPLNIDPSVDFAVNGRIGTLSLLLLCTIWREFRRLPSRLPTTDLACSQNALSFSSGFVGGSILSLPSTGSVVMAARVGSAANVPLLGPFAVPGVTGRGVAGDLVVVEARRTVVFACFPTTGVAGTLAEDLEASFLCSNLAICSSAVSSSVSSPSSSAFEEY